MQSRIEGYYNHFPSKDMNVSVSQVVVDVGVGQSMRKNILVVNKDIKEGEEIYLEDPVVTALDPDLESSGRYCSYCLRKIDSSMSLSFPDDPLHTMYCSKTCQTKARMEGHNILFGLESPLANETSSESVSEHDQKSRKQAQNNFISNLQNNSNVSPLLVARFISRQIAAEVGKIGVSSTGASRVTGGGGISDGEYSLSDHMERLRYLELPTQEEESTLITKVLETAIPGLEKSVYDEKYTILKSKMIYNAIGICYAGGRSDKPTDKCRPENVEKTRTPYGSDRQIGCGIYPVSSYISHSCRPSVRPSFLEGTSSLHLVANRPLKKGDELTMAYVDVSRHSDETLQEARLRRRKELAHGWRFACMCSRCVEEGPQGNMREENIVDESKVEAVYHRYEDNKEKRGVS